MIQIAEDDYFSFYHCLGTMAPMLSYARANHICFCSWINAKDYSSYEECYPEEIKLEGEKISEGEKPMEGNAPRYLLVCDSENMQKKAALFLIREKNSTLRGLARRRNQPLSGRNADDSDSPAMMEVDFASCREKADTEQWNTAFSKLDKWNDVFFKGFRRGVLEEEIARVLLSESEFGCYVGVSRELFGESRIQRLIYEGGYDVVFLPEEDEGYYEDLAVKLFLQPAIREYICAHPGCETYNYEDLRSENPYLDVLGATDTNIFSAVRLLRRKRGAAFQEADIARLFEMAREHGCNVMELLKEHKLRGMAELQGKVGLEQVKDLAVRRTALWKARRRNPLLQYQNTHYLFVGNPGSGKTMAASLLHEVLAENGCVTGNFVAASRSDIIARYVGQTAPKVAELFDRAAGGTLFVDEAGFFLQQGSGGFVQEAIKEFVRYMETRKDVSVIFAVYPGEKEGLLKLDAGLASRLAQVVEFPDYSVEQLCRIGTEMWAEQGYLPDAEAEEALAVFMEKQRAQRRTDFGNAREVRRLVELSIQEAEVRRSVEGFVQETGTYKEQDPAENLKTTILRQDLQKAAELVEKNGTARKQMGFFIESVSEKAVKQKLVCEAV